MMENKPIKTPMEKNLHKLKEAIKDFERVDRILYR